jgi:hypothetical protein
VDLSRSFMAGANWFYREAGTSDSNVAKSSRCGQIHLNVLHGQSKRAGFKPAPTIRNSFLRSLCGSSSFAFAQDKLCG